MDPQLHDIHVDGIRSLVAPVIVIEEIPVEPEERDFVVQSREAARKIFKGEDDRVLVVVGPCSIHDRDSAIEYATRLKAVSDELSGDLLCVMRVYFEKPRTTLGWKGYINDPDCDGSFHINRGIKMARGLLVELSAMGVPAGTEFLDTITPQYIADAVTWGAIGARTTESQVHRQLTSGLSMPVGFKNGTDGNIKISIDAIGAARGAHHFMGVTKQGVSAIVDTRGNDSCHVILRGATKGPNYDAESVGTVLDQIEAAGLPPYIMVDCSHGNSRKDHTRQPGVAEDLAAQISGGQKGIAGVMLESHLVAGAQKAVPGEPLNYGQSITDACMDWETTEGVLRQLAAAVRDRRAAV